MSTLALVALTLFAFKVPLPLLIGFVIAFVLPVLNGLISSPRVGANRRAVLLLLLAFVASFLNEFLTALTRGDTFDVGGWLLLAGGTFVVGVTAHFGLWKPTGVSASAVAAGSSSQDPLEP
jgi:hypothetical protein